MDDKDGQETTTTGNGIDGENDATTDHITTIEIDTSTNIDHLETTTISDQISRGIRADKDLF